MWSNGLASIIIIPNFSYSPCIKSIYIHAFCHVCRATMGGALLPCFSDAGFRQMTCFSQCNVSRSDIIRNLKHTCMVCLLTCAVMIFHKNKPWGSHQSKENKKAQSKLKPNLHSEAKLSLAQPSPTEPQMTHRLLRKKVFCCKWLKLEGCLLQYWSAIVKITLHNYPQTQCTTMSI